MKVALSQFSKDQGNIATALNKEGSNIPSSRFLTVPYDQTKLSPLSRSNTRQALQQDQQIKIIDIKQQQNENKEVKSIFKFSNMSPRKFNQILKREMATSQWRKQELNKSAKKLFEVGNGGISLPDLSYRNARLLDQNAQEEMESRLMQSMSAIKELSQKSQRYIKNQLIPIKFAADQSSTCDIVLDFFKIESKHQKFLQKQAAIAANSVMKKNKGFLIGEYQWPSENKNIFSSSSKAQTPQKQQQNHLWNMMNEKSNIIDPDKDNESQKSDDDDDDDYEDKESDNNESTYYKYQQPEEFDYQGDDGEYDEQGEESEDLDVNKKKKNKMKVKFTSRRRAIDGTAEQLLENQKETYVQPVFMQERGSMCITELWPESMKLELVRSHYQMNKLLKEQQKRKIAPLKGHDSSNNNTNSSSQNYSHSTFKPKNDLKQSSFNQSQQQKSQQQKQQQEQLSQQQQQYYQQGEEGQSFTQLPRQRLSLPHNSQPRIQPISLPRSNLSLSKKRKDSIWLTDNIFQSDIKPGSNKSAHSPKSTFIASYQERGRKSQMIRDSLLPAIKIQNEDDVISQSFQAYMTMPSREKKNKELPKTVKESRSISNSSNHSAYANKKLEIIKNDCEYALENSSEIESIINKKIIEVGTKLKKILSQLR